MKELSHKAPWAIYYNDDAFIAKDGRLMGRHAAGSAYLRAIAQDQFSEVAALLRNNNERENFINLFQSFIPKDKKIDLLMYPWDKPYLSDEFGGIFIGDPQIGNFSILRSNFGHNSYSIVGITHTTMSRNIIDFIGDLITKPTQEWDALICTSNCVKDTVETLIKDFTIGLKERFEIQELKLPEFPIIPLGVHDKDFNFSDKEKFDLRESLGIDPEDIALIFVGRLSFHAKAHYFPMYKSLQEVAKKNKGKKKIHLLQVGWFANDYIKNLFQKDADLICPDIQCHFIDGLNQKNKNLILSSSDIFISLTDNFQETFGLTPLEGMAAGLPVIVTDWDGYRDTVRNNQDGFRIPTLSLKTGQSDDLSYFYHSNITNYDQYISYASQRVSVDIKKTIQKIDELVKNNDLRKKMGANGKSRVKNNYSWKVILNSYSDLRNHLNEKRNFSNLNKNTFNYIKAFDPNNLFKSYPSETLGENHVISYKKKELLDESHYLFTSKSIKISQDINNLDTKYLKLDVNIDVVNSILKVLIDNDSEMNKIYSLLKFSKNEINKTVIMMLKFDIIDLVEVE